LKVILSRDIATHGMRNRNHFGPLVLADSKCFQDGIKIARMVLDTVFGFGSGLRGAAVATVVVGDVAVAGVEFADSRVPNIGYAHVAGYEDEGRSGGTVVAVAVAIMVFSAVVVLVGMRVVRSMLLGMVFVVGVMLARWWTSRCSLLWSSYICSIFLAHRGFGLDGKAS
jgi:hypothetical protein